MEDHLPKLLKTCEHQNILQIRKSRSDMTDASQLHFGHIYYWLSMISGGGSISIHLFLLGGDRLCTIHLLSLEMPVLWVTHAPFSRLLGLGFSFCEVCGLSICFTCFVKPTILFTKYFVTDVCHQRPPVDNSGFDGVSLVADSQFIPVDDSSMDTPFPQSGEPVSLATKPSSARQRRRQRIQEDRTNFGQVRTV